MLNHKLNIFFMLWYYITHYQVKKTNTRYSQTPRVVQSSNSFSRAWRGKSTSQHTQVSWVAWRRIYRQANRRYTLLRIRWSSYSTFRRECRAPKTSSWKPNYVTWATTKFTSSGLSTTATSDAGNAGSGLKSDWCNKWLWVEVGSRVDCCVRFGRNLYRHRLSHLDDHPCLDRYERELDEVAALRRQISD